MLLHQLGLLANILLHLVLLGDSSCETLPPEASDDEHDTDAAAEEENHGGSHIGEKAHNSDVFAAAPSDANVHALAAFNARDSVASICICQLARLTRSLHFSKFKLIVKILISQKVSNIFNAKNR